MTRKTNRQTSIRGRLRQMSFLHVVVFALIVASLFYASSTERKNIDLIVEDSFYEISRNSQNSRNFGLLHTRLSVFESTFYTDEQWFKTESEIIQKKISDLRTNVSGSKLEKPLTDLEKQFFVYLKRRTWVNWLIYWRSEQDEDIGDLFTLLQEIIAEKMITVTLEGGDTDYLEQLVLLISGYRESLYEIAKLNAQENPAHLLSASLDSPVPLEKELHDLTVRLGTLTASESPIDRLGRHLIDRFAHYDYLMQQYQREMNRLGELTRNLDQRMAYILSLMEQLDEKTALDTLRAREEIRRSSNMTAVIVLGLLGFLAGFFWLSHRSLFRKHIQTPMELISHRLERFQQGDHSTPMSLKRNDEWEGIEIVFNKMLANLEESMSALRGSEKRYREIFTNTTEGIFRATLSGRFIELNPAAASILGFDSAEEAIEAYPDLGENLYPDPQERERILNHLYRHEKNLNYETLMRRADGTEIWASISNYLVRDEDGNVLHIEGTFRNISEQRAARESLQQLKAYLQNIIDSMPSILIGVDINMVVTLWNRRAMEESNTPSENAIGLPFAGACQLFEQAVYLPKLVETLRTRRPNRLLRVESVKKTVEGNSRYFDILIYPLSLIEASGAVIHMDDVTDRIHLEEMMVRSEKMQSIGGLAAGLAHEINNPLAVILQNVQVLSRRLSPNLDKNQQTAQELGTTVETIAEYIKLRGCEKMLHSISAAGQRAAKIVENMQSFSRRGASNFIPCSLTDLVERTIELAGSDHDMRKNFDFKKIRIIRDYGVIPHVCCEASQIQQVVLSLLKNAAQALSAGTEDPQITIRLLLSEEDCVQLQIEDNGPGMSDDVVARIFDPFYTTREVGQGTGLGLSVAYFIVTQNHRGSLSVKSEKGRGSQFDLLLPVTHDAEVCALY